MLRKIRRLSKLSVGEWLVLFQLVLSALIVTVAIRLVSLPFLIKILSRCAQNPLIGRFPLFRNRFGVSRVTNLADIAAWVTHSQGRCLMRSLLLFWLLKARGEPAELLIGVLDAHAWIETRGRVIGDTANMTRSFATLLRY